METSPLLVHIPLLAVVVMLVLLLTGTWLVEIGVQLRVGAETLLQAKAHLLVAAGTKAHQLLQTPLVAGVALFSGA